MKLKDFLRVGRAQTAPASVLLMFVGILLGGGELLSLAGLAFLLFAILFHIASFGQNSVMDSAIKPEIGEGLTVDEQDDSKSNHPIINGSVSLRTGFLSINILLYALMVVAVAIPFYTPGNTALALASFAVWIIFGQAYNNGISIFTKWKWVYISVCFTGLSLYFYFLYATDFTMLMGLVSIYIFLRVWFQNGYAGEMKDLTAPEDNMLRTMGATIEKDVIVEEFKGIEFKKAGDVFKPKFARIYCYALTLAEIFVGYEILFVVSGGIISMWYVHVPFSVLMGAGLVFCLLMAHEREWGRDRELKHMGLMEIIFIYALPIALIPIIGYIPVLVLLIFGVAWFYGMNKWLWGSSHPAV